MKALSVAYKDMQIFFQDRGVVFELFLLPLVFIFVFSGALGAAGSGEADTRIRLPVVDLDGGDAAQTLLAGLDSAGGLLVEQYDQEEATALLAENDIGRVLTIPPGFTSGIAEGLRSRCAWSITPTQRQSRPKQCDWLSRV